MLNQKLEAYLGAIFKLVFAGKEWLNLPNGADLSGDYKFNAASHSKKICQPVRLQKLCQKCFIILDPAHLEAVCVGERDREFEKGRERGR